MNPNANDTEGAEVRRGPDDSNDGRLSRRGVLGAAGAVATTGILGTGGASASSDGSGSCGPDAGSSPPPGPPVLYGAPVTAPQFENGDGWDAEPLLVCGASAYDGGEFLYQDWVYDDYGANTDDADLDPQPPTATTLASPAGDVVYPTDDDRYRDNAADLLEFRCRPQGNRVAYRLTLNTMVEPDAAVVGVGIDRGDATETDWGRGLGDLGAPVDGVLVTWGTGAAFDGENGTVRSVDVDERRNQIEVVVDFEEPPGEATWRHYCVTGVHDGDGGFAPVREQADEDHPGGAKGQDPPPVFNVAFREEPIGDPAHWRDQAQANALADRDVSEFGADVSFGRLRRRATDRTQADPEGLTGFVNRLFSSRVAIDGGTSYSPGEEGVEDDGDDAVLTGRVQPYSVYIPESYDPSHPGPLHVLPHSLGQSYNQYAGTPNLLGQLGEQRDSIVLMFEGRGPAGWWHDEAEFDLFEAWADFRHRYAYDEDRVTLGGYSMGGYATYRLASLYPDLFARGFEIVGPPDESIFGGPTDGAEESEHNTLDVTDNVRHVPLLMWHGSNDELVPLPGPVNYAEDLRGHGYRHELDVFPGYDHFLFSVRDQWGPGRDFLESATVTRNPERVTYRSKPAMGNPRFGLTYDSAYWLSGIEVVDPESDDGGLVDAISYADGYVEPVAEDYEGAGTEPAPHTKQGTRWREPLEVGEARNALSIELTDVSAVTVWVEEAGLDSSGPIELSVESTHEATVTLASSAGTREVAVPPGTTERTVRVCDG